MILVAGATGVLGSEIVRRLRGQEHSVRALVRTTSSPDKIAALEHLGVAIARGDVKQRRSLDAAVMGVDAVISTVTTILTSQPGDSFDATDRDGSKNLIDAAAAAGVKHFVFVSFDATHVPESPLADAKREVEAHLRRSGMTYTILQPGLFMESWLGPFLFADPSAATAKVYGAGTRGINYVAVPDVAEVAVRSLTVASARDASIPFGGPEALSQRGAVKMFEDEYGKPFNLTELPEAALEAQWRGASDPFQRSFAALMLAVSRGVGSGLDVPPADFGISRMTRPREFVRRSANAEPATSNA